MASWRAQKIIFSKLINRKWLSIKQAGEYSLVYSRRCCARNWLGFWLEFKMAPLMNTLITSFWIPVRKPSNFCGNTCAEYTNEVFACLFMDNHFSINQFWKLFFWHRPWSQYLSREIVRRGLLHNAARYSGPQSSFGNPAPSLSDREVNFLNQKCPGIDRHWSHKIMWSLVIRRIFLLLKQHGVARNSRWSTVPAMFSRRLDCRRQYKAPGMARFGAGKTWQAQYSAKFL